MSAIGYKKSTSRGLRQEIEYMHYAYPVCRGQRLKKESLAVTVGDRNIYEATNMSIVKFK